MADAAFLAGHSDVLPQRCISRVPVSMIYSCCGVKASAIAEWAVRLSVDGRITRSTVTAELEPATYIVFCNRNRYGSRLNECPATVTCRGGGDQLPGS